MGTPNFALSSLKSLWSNKFSIDLVVTNPDRPVGRGMHLTPSPVKQFALDNGLKVIDDFECFLNKVPRYSDSLFVIVAYGKILPMELVNNHKIINVHSSLLPKYRGASPIQSALLNGDTKTGVSTMFVTPKMDSGPVLLQKEVNISANETYHELHDELALAGSELLIETITNLDTLKPVEQNESLVTYCKKIQKEDRLIDLNWDPLKIHNTVRAIGGFFFDEGKRIVLTRSVINESDSKPELWVKPEGKKEMTITDYYRGRKNVS